MLSFILIALIIYCFFFFNDTATTEIYTLSLHDALPIYHAGCARRQRAAGGAGEIRRVVPRGRRRLRAARVRRVRARVGREAGAADRPRPRDGEGVHCAELDGGAPRVVGRRRSAPLSASPSPRRRSTLDR